MLPSRISDGAAVQPNFIELPEIKIVGLGTNFIASMSPQQNNLTVIPKLWGEFIARADAIPHRAGHVFFGVVEPLPASAMPRHGEMYYIACVEVTDFNAVPAGMIQRTIPAGRYAVFTHKGDIDTLGQTMAHIYGAWLPTSGIKLRSAPTLERYDQRFIPNSDQSEFDILLPVP